MSNKNITNKSLENEEIKLHERKQIATKNKHLTSKIQKKVQ